MLIISVSTGGEVLPGRIMKYLSEMFYVSKMNSKLKVIRVKRNIKDYDPQCRYQGWLYN